MNQRVHAAATAAKGTYEKAMAFLNSKLGFLIVGMVIMAGIRAWKMVLPGLFFFMGIPGGSPLTNLVDPHQAPPPMVMTSMATPMPACALAMRDMHDALVTLNSTVAAQDRRMQELTNTMSQGFKDTNQRIDNLLLNGGIPGRPGPHSKATGIHYDREVLDQALEMAAAKADLVLMNDAESRMR